MLENSDVITSAKKYTFNLIYNDCLLFDKDIKENLMSEEVQGRVGLSVILLLYISTKAAVLSSSKLHVVTERPGKCCRLRQVLVTCWSAHMSPHERCILRMGSVYELDVFPFDFHVLLYAQWWKVTTEKH